LPSTWDTPFDVFAEVDLVPGTKEYKEVEDNFMASLGAGGSKCLEVRMRLSSEVLSFQYSINNQENNSIFVRVSIVRKNLKLKMHYFIILH